MLVFAKVMEIVGNLYQLESPFFGLTYAQILLGLFLLRFGVWMFHAVLMHEFNAEMWGDKKYDKGNN